MAVLAADAPVSRLWRGTGADRGESHPLAVPTVHATGGALKTGARLKDTAAKGRKLVNLAAKILESKGAKVEIAGNQVRWWQDKATKRWVPRSVKHDFFGVWDMIAVLPSGDRTFCQVTTLHNVSDRRRKILESGVWWSGDAILAYVGRPRRHFRVYRGPLFQDAEETWTP